ncbi:MAG: hypothetical protein AB7L66_05330 [Gemmatimonadales bacterium]
MSSFRNRPLAVLGALGVLFAAGCGGGSEPTSPPPPPPPPPVDNVRNVAIQAGNNQTAKVGQAVAVPPSVRVTNSTGAPVAGVSVTFAVTAGGGTVGGASASTGSDGIAAVGSWTLGAVGANGLSATVTGATTGSPAAFAATGEEVLIQPVADTAMSGVVSVTRLVVPAGVTVTVVDSLVLSASGAVEIRGTLAGNCVPVRIDGQQLLTIKGTVRNACPAAGAAAPLTLIGRGGYDVDSAVVETSGALVLTTDPTLTDGAFQPSAASAVARTAASGALAPGECLLRSSQLRAVPDRAADGANGAKGGAGASAHEWRLDCDGFLKMRGQLTVRAQDGGNGGDGSVVQASDAIAEGGNGGKGGALRVRSTGAVIFEGDGNELRSGNGGRGGSATAVGLPTGGLVAPGAEATGGTGGEPGLITIEAVARVEFNSPTDFFVGNGGDGGNAKATGSDGFDAAGLTSPAEAGGRALATAGFGAGTPNKQLKPTNLVVIQPENVRLHGGAGGFGGHAEALAGVGGNGFAEKPDGAAGGAARALGGFGGDAQLKDLDGQLFGAGGSGGDALIQGANGGHGAARCDLPLGFLHGGNGGRGGDLDLAYGIGGLGATGGVDGTGELREAGNGGNGNNGEPAGNSGPAGSVSANSDATRTGHIGLIGRFGFECIGGIGDFKVVVNGLPAIDPCPRPAFTGQISSFSPGPVQFEITEGIPAFGTTITSGTLAPAPGPVNPWSHTLIPFTEDLCTMLQTAGFLVEGPVTYTFTLGPTTVVKTMNVRYEFKP